MIHLASSPPSRTALRLRGEGTRSIDSCFLRVAKRPETHGLQDTKASIASKPARGTFATTFFQACLAALDCGGVRLQDI
ncbi:MAG: DUF6471 domain-containing protein [Beijerinckiaceae bacterium]